MHGFFNTQYILVLLCNRHSIRDPVIVRTNTSSSFLESILLTFIEEIRLSTPKVDNLGTTISVFLLLRTLFAVVSIRDPNPSAYSTPALERPVVAFVANTHQSAGTHVRITNHAFPVAFLTQSSDGNAGLFPAHDQIRVMLCHGY